MRLVIISGRSGSGKSVALKAAEDLGFYCVDNLPVTMLQELLNRTGDSYTDVAVGIDARGGSESPIDIVAIRRKIETAGWTTEVLFVDADSTTLLKRFSETRRRHPLTHLGLSLQEGIDRERHLLEPLAMAADLIIDTSNIKPTQLRNRIHERLLTGSAGGLDLVFESFGYKHGVPRDANFVFDARCLPNPYWEEHLRTYTGRDKPIIDYLQEQPTVMEFIWQIKILLQTWLPRFEEEKRSYMTVAIGCTGGQHRSVYTAEQLARYFRQTFRNVRIHHRELENSHD